MRIYYYLAENKIYVASPVGGGVVIVVNFERNQKRVFCHSVPEGTGMTLTYIVYAFACVEP